MKRVLIVLMSLILTLTLIFGFVDYSRASNGEEVIFAAFEWFNWNDESSEHYYVYHIGFLYYLKEEKTISPTQPLSASPSVKMSIWFLPGIEIYSWKG